MAPISWDEMLCPQTKLKEPRKVAKASAPQLHSHGTNHFCVFRYWLTRIQLNQMPLCCDGILNEQ